MKKIIATISFLVISCLNADEIIYANSVKSLYANKDDKIAIGRLLPTAPVKVLQKDGNFLKIEIVGFIQDGKEQAIYFSEGKRILNAAFKKNAPISIKILEDRNWDKVSVVAYVENSDFESEVGSMLGRAAKLYEENCSICHSLHNINEYNANQWPGIIESMISRTAISKKDKFLVNQYLQKTTTKQ
ncbi:hypothetical protein F1B92_00500 [Campylobacter sp. FMV-PI01]|uniref:Cytochrome C n=1 Tax=Campylobacter portucalensis TaxID=2608384 RepID=A0A6L5WIZ5_9BACT|nr:hypothetical protein [Campylobacter portucalensis]MSN95691.1 hypothetical protein [Campylobacter portucalensis]